MFIKHPKLSLPQIEISSPPRLPCHSHPVLADGNSIPMETASWLVSSLPPHIQSLGNSGLCAHIPGVWSPHSSLRKLLKMEVPLWCSFCSKVKLSSHVLWGRLYQPPSPLPAHINSATFCPPLQPPQLLRLEHARNTPTLGSGSFSQTVT